MGQSHYALYWKTCTYVDILEYHTTAEIDPASRAPLTRPDFFGGGVGRVSRSRGQTGARFGDRNDGGGARAGGGGRAFLKMTGFFLQDPPLLLGGGRRLPGVEPLYCS